MIYIKSALVLLQIGANNIFCWSGAYDNCGMVNKTSLSNISIFVPFSYWFARFQILIRAPLSIWRKILGLYDFCHFLENIEIWRIDRTGFLFTYCSSLKICRLSVTVKHSIFTSLSSIWAQNYARTVSTRPIWLDSAQLLTHCTVIYAQKSHSEDTLISLIAERVKKF